MLEKVIGYVAFAAAFTVGYKLVNRTFEVTVVAAAITSNNNKGEE